MVDLRSMSKKQLVTLVLIKYPKALSLRVYFILFVALAITFTRYVNGAMGHLELTIRALLIALMPVVYASLRVILELNGVLTNHPKRDGEENPQ